MSTMLRIGPHDHGRELTYEEFLEGDYEEGHKYELIDGSLYVSPPPRLRHDWVEEYVGEKLVIYKQQHRDIVRYLSHKARVFVPGRRKTTCPEPDFAVYRDFPKDKKDLKWQKVSPLIVVEIVSPGDPDKDYVRNVVLFWQVPSILEYWVFDKVEDDDGPVLKVYRREPGKQDWVIDDYGPDAVYTTPLLPDFSLPVTPDE